MESNDPGFLFIGGAPRSGTTLLARLLDGHPRLRVFPVEHSTFERAAEWQTNASTERRAYFRTRFIEDRRQGQQTLLASATLMEEYRARMHREFGIHFDLPLDHDRFKSAYLNALGSDLSLPGDVLKALSEGLSAAAPSVPAAPIYTVFKQPYYTELYAGDTAQRLPKARFIHMVRDPRSRYASAKKRRVDKKGGVSPRINGEVFVMGIAEMSVSSLHLGLQNRELIGHDRYRMVRFEDLVTDGRETLNAILAWLDLAPDERVQRPTQLSEGSESGSSFRSSRSVDEAATHRDQQLRELATPAELQLHDYLLGLSRYKDWYDLEATSLRGYRRRWWRPFGHERRRDYLWRLLTGRLLILSPKTRLLERLEGRLPRLALRQGHVENT